MKAIALLTIRKNHKDNIQARIGSLGSAKEALKKAYERKIFTDLNSISKIQFNNRTQSIEEYTTA